MQLTQHSSRYFQNWYKIALFNLLLVALIGSLLRYKLVASLPWVNHKYFLYGHSHFAFAGWISLVLMVAIVSHIQSTGLIQKTNGFHQLLVAHMVTAYGMLLSFPLKGYAALSISFSTASILVSFWFVAKTWRFCHDKTWGPAGALAIRAALIFLVVSSLGAFALAGLMTLQAHNQAYYFSALYFFLHFQYNGWFFFGIAALLATRLPETGSYHLYRGIKWLVWACFPAVILSGLWMKVPGWIFWIAGLVVLVQIRGLGLVVRGLIPAWRQWSGRLHGTEKWLLRLSFVATTLRFLLQSLSAIPALSRFAFAYRPVVIGYLHLVLLGCITLFLLSWLYAKGLWQKNQNAAAVGMAVFIAGIIGTEGTLMLQGFGYIGWVSIPYTNEILFASALLMAAGILILFAAARTFSAYKD